MYTKQFTGYESLEFLIPSISNYTVFLFNIFYSIKIYGIWYTKKFKESRGLKWKFLNLYNHANISTVRY